MKPTGRFLMKGDLRAWLETWPNEMMWLITTSQLLYGCSTTAEELKQRYRLYPPPVAESKLKWMFGKYYYSHTRSYSYGSSEARRDGVRRSRQRHRIPL